MPLPGDDSALTSPDITSLCTGSGSIFIGTGDGRVDVVSKALRTVQSFQAYEETGRVTFMKQPKGTSMLVTLCEDAPQEPMLKVWALDKLDKHTSTPALQCTVNIHNGKKQFPVSAFVTVKYLEEVAIGFANGAVVLVRGDLIHDRGTKQKLVFESEEPITGLAFSENKKNTTLFVATTGRILTYVVAGKSQGQPARVLESTGCALGCMMMKDSTANVVVVREDAIYIYEPNGRGPCYAFEGKKNLLHLHENYVCLVLPTGAQNDFSMSDNMKRLSLGGTDTVSTTRFIILDTNNMFLAYSGAFTSDIRAVFSQWGDLYVLTRKGALYRHREKDMTQKLDILFQRNLYVLAITLGESAGFDRGRMNSIYKRYGDHLYHQGDTDGAMQQYIRAVNEIEPSQVIRKYLDAQLLHNLIEYLEELDRLGKANPDHSTLLLSCYTKMKDEDKLKSFIESRAMLDLNLETAIPLCRQGGYFSEAVELAKRHGETAIVLEILVEDLQQCGNALRYVRHLPASQVLEQLHKYGGDFMQEIADETTSLLIDLFMGTYSAIQAATVPTIKENNLSVANSLLHNYASYLPYMKSSTPPDSKDPSTSSTNNTIKPSDPVAPTAATYEAPNPHDVFSIFVGHPLQFIRFLEACLQSQRLPNPKYNIKDLSSTLFELYLEEANRAEDDDEKRVWRKKAKMMVDDEDEQVESQLALLVSHLKAFEEGKKVIREKGGLKLDNFRAAAAAGDTAGLIEAVRRYGPTEPEVYPMALSYFTQSPKVLRETRTEFMEVLERIQENNLMAPLEVIQSLSSNAVATMGMVKPYLSHTIEYERKDIEKAGLLLALLISESKTHRQLPSGSHRKTRRDSKARNKVRLIDIALKCSPTLLQPTRCSFCGGNLDLPIVHFLCKHSYHQRCLNEVDGNFECPICESNNQAIRAIRDRQEEMASRHDTFKSLLAESDDKFKLISDLFGRGIMDVHSGDELQR